jgi:coatomer protein complex subunit epsilon
MPPSFLWLFPIALSRLLALRYFLYYTVILTGHFVTLYTGLQALSLKAQFESAGDDSAKAAIVDQLKSFVASNPVPAVQLAAAHVLLAADQTKEALQCVHGGATIEHIATILQIYLKIDRLDLAKKQLQILKQQDEDAVLTQLGSVYCNLASGSTGAADAVHSLNSMTEQYGASPLLLNLMATALMQQGDFSAAEEKLQECLRDHETPVADTLINLISCSVQQSKSADQYIGEMKQQYPSHAFCAGLDRVTAAFDREAVKYMV